MMLCDRRGGECVCIYVLHAPSPPTSPSHFRRGGSLLPAASGSHGLTLSLLNSQAPLDEQTAQTQVPND